MKRVLVTGAAGFIGRHALGPLVTRGFEVHAVSRSPRPRQDGVTWHRADLLDGASPAQLIEAVRPSHLLHLAWTTEPSAYWRSPANLDWLAASLALVRAFSDAGGERVVGAGTCAEYDWRRLGAAPCPERNTPCAPHTLYGQAKHAMHRVLAAYAAETGLSHAWGRIFLLYGPDEPPARLVPATVRALLAGEPARCTHGRQVRDLMDARDAGAAFATLLDSAAEGPVNVASGEGVSVAEVATRLGNLLGRPDLVELGALEARPDDPPYLVADVTRLTTEVGFRPAHDLDAGLADAVAWWRERTPGASQ